MPMPCTSPAARPQGVPSVARAAAVTGIRDRPLLEALAEAAVRAMPQLSAADICSVVESFSGAGLGALQGLFLGLVQRSTLSNGAARAKHGLRVIYSC